MTTVTQVGSVALAGFGAVTVLPYAAPVSPLLLRPFSAAAGAPAACSSTSASTGQYQPEWRRFAVEMGTGTSLRREDHTAAAVRALQDALWRVSLTAYRALDKDPNSMRAEILIGVPKPEEVDHETVLAVVPYGDRSIRVVKGGLAIDGGCGADAQGQIIVANAAAIVSLDVGDYLAFKKGSAEAKAEGEAEDDEQLWTSPSGAIMSATEAEAILAKHFK